ncbi:hypothetical protein FUAX_53350 (plasmid) [Fulvitalea axinellae]|uniref:Uncharacterized protein n=1 Tax=Fulvitalea axinellae TaxID=1182444 RepID=A0AAU9CY86_9BACT|nr:hypothetical protein FUAX_53350 [Fulvitalea axinellae]
MYCLCVDNLWVTIRVLEQDVFSPYIFIVLFIVRVDDLYITIRMGRQDTPLSLRFL